MVKVRVLGPFEVEIGGSVADISATKERVLLAVLASRAGRQVPMDLLADELWPDRSRQPANVAAGMQVLVSRLRRHLGEASERLVAHRGGYSLVLADAELDAAEFQRGFREGRDLLEDGDPQAAATVLRTALELWHGSAYEDIASTTTDSDRTRLEEARTGAREALFEAELATGRHAELLPELDQAIDQSPFHERFWGMKMVALYRSGRQADALRTYHALRRLTLDELGFEPTPELQRLELALLEQSPDLDQAGAGQVLTLGSRETGVRLGQLPLQPRLHASTERPIVGRDLESAVLRGCRDRSGPRRLRAAVVSGEPGAGKTRLVVDAAIAAHAEGSVVLAGRCDEHPTGPFQPVAEAVHWLLAHLPVSVLTATLPDVTLAKLRQLANPAGTAYSAVPYGDSDPHQLFEAVASLFAVVSTERQLVLLLEDVHWMDAPTATLLRYLTRRLEGEAVVVLCTQRSDPAQQSEAMHEFIQVLRRAARVHEVAVDMLDAAAVSALARSVLGRPVDAEAAAAIHEETAGNPLFVVELLRHLLDTGALDLRHAAGDAQAVRTAAPPDSIRELVEQRISRLDDRTVAVLSVGAVLGREFDSAVLARCSDLTAAAVDRSLDLARDAGLVEHVREVPGRNTFNHAITRRTLYDRILTTDRADLHAKVAQVLESDGLGTAAQIALHYYSAASVGPVAKVLSTGIRAAQEAQRGLAFDDSVEVLSRTVPLIDARGSIRDRVELRLHLGDAYWWAGDVARSQSICAEALELLRQDPDRPGELFARAVLGRWRNNGAATQGFSAAEPDLELIDMLDEALAGLTEHPALRAALLGRLGIASYWTVPLERRQEIADSAVALARASGSEAVLLDVLVDSQLSLWAPGAEPQRLQRSVEILTLARKLGQTAREADARTFEAVDQLALGDVEAADVAIRRYLRASSTLRQPFYRWHAHFLPSLRALMDGRFDEAESLTSGATDAGEGDGPGAEGAFALTGLQTLWLFYERGRLEEIAPILEMVAGSFGEIPAMDAARTWVAAETGNTEIATKLLNELLLNDFDIAQTDIAWLSAMCLLGSAAATIGHLDACRRIHDIIAPYAGRNSLIWVGFCTGPVDHYLGRLTAAIGDPKAATAHLDRALDLAERMHARPIALRIRLDRCRLAVDAGTCPVDELATVRAGAEELGMPGLVAEADHLLDVAGGTV